MVRHRKAEQIARVTLAAARVEQAAIRLAAIEQCPSVLDPSAPWTQCKLVAGHDQWQQDKPPTKHETGPGLRWVD